jgi:hypothetical protein
VTMARVPTPNAQGSALASRDHALTYVESCSKPAQISYASQVTTVGGTAGANPEVGINFSGGGWSDMFGVPAYQQEAVQSYIKGLNGNNTSRFNVVCGAPTMRATCRAEVVCSTVARTRTSRLRHKA